MAAAAWAGCTSRPCSCCDSGAMHLMMHRPAVVSCASAARLLVVHVRNLLQRSTQFIKRTQCGCGDAWHRTGQCGDVRAQCAHLNRRHPKIIPVVGALIICKRCEAVTDAGKVKHRAARRRRISVRARGPGPAQHAQTVIESRNATRDDSLSMYGLFGRCRHPTVPQVWSPRCTQRADRHALHHS
jgi:hypothetical protein